MNIGKAIHYKTKNTAAITAYSSNRIYPKVSPQGAKLPNITYQIISNPPIHAMRRDAKLYRPRVQIDYWSTSYSQCRLMAKEGENLWRDLTGVISTGSSGITVQRSFWQDEGEIAEVSPQAEITHHIWQEYLIWHTTTT